MLVLSGQADAYPWLQIGPGFNALAITAATVFTAIRLFPPTFHPFFSKVTDFRKGNREGRFYALPVPKGKMYPVFVAIVNTGTFTWDNQRVTIKLHESFEVKEFAEDEFPNCKNWDFAIKPDSPDSLIIGQGYVQKKSTTVLTIGETLATRFFVKAKEVGVFEMEIMMTSAGRIGEQRQSLWLHVEEESQA